MLKKFLFILFSVSIFSCGSGDPIPPGVLSREKMEKVLTQIHLTQAVRQQKLIQQQPVTDTTFNEVFKNEQVTQEQFDNSMKFYTSHPALLDQVYDEVISELTRMQREELKKK
ncbi:MAG TPA: DUF4296 domain-containing protein [Bacteroidia bacterium]|jgi:hypothetical protein